MSKCVDLEKGYWISPNGLICCAGHHRPIEAIPRVVTPVWKLTDFATGLLADPNGRIWIRGDADNVDVHNMTHKEHREHVRFLLQKGVSRLQLCKTALALGVCHKERNFQGLIVWAPISQTVYYNDMILHTNVPESTSGLNAMSSTFVVASGAHRSTVIRIWL